MLRRVVTEQRRFLVPLAVVLAVNVGLYAAVVYPLGARVADASRRSAEAENARLRAQREFAEAQDIATGKAKAEAGLKTFYDTVLPADLSAANRVTYMTLSQLARRAGVRITRRQASPEGLRDSALAQLKATVTVEGSYEQLRRFIYELETAPAFVLMDAVAIAQGRDTSRPLVLTLGLSTYYRALDHAS